MVSVFISWSGEESRHAAAALHRWLPLMLQKTRVWMSDENIQSGQRWASEIAAQLSSVDLGILCITASNLSAPWLLFEAGALAKSVANARVIPWLLDPAADKAIAGPLGQFQAQRANKDETFAIVKDLANLGGSELEASALQTTFGSLWPMLEQELCQRPLADGANEAAAKSDQILSEILIGVREIQRQLASNSLLSTSVAQVPDASPGERMGMALVSNLLTSLLVRAETDPEGAATSIRALGGLVSNFNRDRDE